MPLTHTQCEDTELHTQGARILPVTIADAEQTESQVNHADILAALSPYRPEYRMVVEASSEIPYRHCRASVVFPVYPFILDPIPYASLSLLNLAVEQVLLTYVRFEVRYHCVETHLWSDLRDYDRKVAAGHWLVPRLQTRIRRLVPTAKPVVIKTRIAGDKLTGSSYRIEFTANSDAGFSASGTAVFVKDFVSHDR